MEIADDRIAIVIPTYNEADNIKKLVSAICAIYPRARIFVVVDNSPDGTAHIVSEAARKLSNLTLIWREKREGLSTAYLDAFARIIGSEDIQGLITMDADFSHDPDDLQKLARAAGDADVVVGSRYVAGGRIENWARWRKIISVCGNVYTRFILQTPVRDLTSGFVFYRRETLGKILLAGVAPRQPYAFQTEMKYIARLLGARVREVPITFRERASGKSKLKRTAIIEALFFPWYLRFFKKR